MVSFSLTRDRYENVRNKMRFVVDIRCDFVLQ